MPSLIFRKGLDMKGAVADELAQAYKSPIVDAIKNSDYAFREGRLTFPRAGVLGF
ncbi:MAG: hypothetical protein AB1806_07375 [Acidobacteriota bacterium]